MKGECAYRQTLLKLSAACCILMTFVIALVGCAHYARQQQQGRFEDITEAYGNAIRWGKYEVANGYRVGGGTEGRPDFERLKKIKVTSYELKAVTVSSDANTVQQDVEIEYYNVDRFIEKTIIDRQLWKYDKEEGRWFLHSAFPDFQ